MAFPTSPSDGQVYEKYIYDNTIGAWDMIGEILEQGSNTNGKYIKYTNGDLSQWSVRLTMPSHLISTGESLTWTFPGDDFINVDYNVIHSVDNENSGSKSNCGEIYSNGFYLSRNVSNCSLQTYSYKYVIDNDVYLWMSAHGRWKT